MRKKTDKTKELSQRLLDKSIESFTLGLEIYNKPTINYRVEGFSMFICNAWELMLKSHLINTEGLESIYYKDNPDRTKSLSDCLRVVLTNKNDPVRKNLKTIIELRNTSTHFITEEFETLFAPLFQSCIFNFEDKMFSLHNKNLSDYFPKNLLYLSLSAEQINRDSVKLKYDDATYNKLSSLNNLINNEAIDSNEKYAAIYKHELVQVKSKDADITFKIDKESDNLGLVIVRDVDPLMRCNLTQSKCVQFVNNNIKKLELKTDFRTHKARDRGEEIKPDFNTHTFQQFIFAYNIKSNTKLCYENKLRKPSTFSYSMQLVEAIIDAIKTNPMDLNLVLDERIKLNSKE